jgi:hypothetical protein
MPRVEVVPIEGRRWAVQYEDDITPISTHDTEAEAETAARVHAAQFNSGVVLVRGMDGHVRESQIIDPEERVGP